MLTKITVEGLRGFADKTVVNFASYNGTPGSGLTLITGPNNAGKSTIIETLKLHSSIHQSPSFNLGMRNAKTDSVQIEYEINGKTETLRSRRPGSSETEMVDRSENLTPYVVPSRRHFSPNFSRTSKMPRNDYVKHHGSHSGVREQTLTNFEGRLFQIETESSQFDKILREVVPDFMKWSIDQHETGQYFIKLVSDGKAHSLSGSGDGVVSVFVIIASLFDSKPGDFIAIDEPELSLHPKIQIRLSRLIRKYAADRQIVVSTHSPYFVDPEALSNGAHVIRCWSRKNTIEIFTLSSVDCSYLKALLTPNRNNPHVFGLDARDIFFADDPILVFEGQEDVVLWPTVASSHPALAELPTYGWGAGGAANITNVVGVLQRLGYRQVCGVLDNNRPGDLGKLRTTFPDYLFVELPAADVRTKPAVAAREAVDGLLDATGNVRRELSQPLDSLLTEIGEFLAK